MYLRKHTLAVVTTTDSTDTFTTTGDIDYGIYGVELVHGATPLSSTASVAVITGTGAVTIISGVSCSTGNWMLLPRVKESTSTGTLASAGIFPVYGEKVSVVVSETSAAGQLATVNLYEGGE